MKKYWCIGLVLLVGFAACSDKKAEQAAALKKEIQDSLAQAAGSGPQKMLSYGDVTVAPDGDVYHVTIDKVSVTVAGVLPVDIGKIGFKLAPDGDDLRKFSDLSLPTAVTIKSEDGKETVKAAIALDHGTGSWSKKLGILLSADLLFKSVDFSQEGSADHVAGTDVGYLVTSTDVGDGRWDQQGTFNAKHLVVASSDGQLDAVDFVVKSNLSGAKLAEIAALRADLKKAIDSKKADETFATVGKLFQLFKSAKGSISLGKISVASGGQPVFTVNGFGLDFGMENADQPKVKVSTGLRYAGLAIPQITGLVGGLGAEVLPTDFNLTLSIADLPFESLVTAWSKSLPEGTPGGQEGLMTTGMAAAGAASQVLEQSPIKLTLSDGMLAAPAFTGKFSGELATMNSGASATVNVELSDLDAVIAQAEKYKDEPETAMILGVVQQMRALSDRGTDAGGKPIDRFKVTYDSTGSTLVNGKPLPMGGQ
jgi:hypothetical protein